MDYLVRLIQVHESFRRAELDALAELTGLDIEILEYSEESPYCILRFPSLDITHPNASPSVVAKHFISRAILSRSIYELWGFSATGDHSALHTSVHQRSSHLWPDYKTASFAFTIDTYLGALTPSQQRDRMNSFAYIGFDGPIDLKNPAERFIICEEYDRLLTHNPIPGSFDRKPKRLFFGRWLGDSARHLVDVHDLKKRPYISTTSMDAELALVTANLALAAPGKLLYDPFVGTGGFLVSAAQFGAMCWGSDIDGRSFRGKEPKQKAKHGKAPEKGDVMKRGLDNGVGKNMIKYGTRHNLLDCFTSDLTNTPFRLPHHHSHPSDTSGYLDAILSDPPYGVREGLKVLGLRAKFSDLSATGEPGTDAVPPIHMLNGVPAHTLPDYIAPKRPYSFERMLDDILAFAARSLVVGGRLVFWMPVAGARELNAEEDIDEEKEGGGGGSDAPPPCGASADNGQGAVPIPQHPRLLLLSCCVQNFNKWSRRLLVYKKLADSDSSSSNSESCVGRGDATKGKTANELNEFRRRYFETTATPSSPLSKTKS